MRNSVTCPRLYLLVCFLANFFLFKSRFRCCFLKEICWMTNMHIKYLFFPSSAHYVPFITSTLALYLLIFFNYYKISTIHYYFYLSYSLNTYLVLQTITSFRTRPELVFTAAEPEHLV